MPAEKKYTWPAPYLLSIYAKAVEEGCIRIRLRGPDFAAEYASLRASFNRLRRRKDGHFGAIMRPEYMMCSMSFEDAANAALVTYSSLPDGNTLPLLESVSEQRPLSDQPPGVQPKPTLEEAEFDSTSFVAGLLTNLKLEDEDDGSTTEL